MRVAVLGLGEAGRIYAEGFAELGATVTGYDPVAVVTPSAFTRASSVAEAVAGVDVVVSLVGAAASERVLADVIDAGPSSAVFADLNTGSPELKARLDATARAAGLAFADVAVMAPVPRSGIRTRLLTSGPGAASVSERFSRIGIPIAEVGRDAGDAAGLKLLRSVFMKGLAALVYEATTAADAVGSRDWMIHEMAGELGPDGEALVTRLIDGTAQHAERRAHEMEDVEGYLAGLGTPSWMTASTLAWLRAIARGDHFLA